MGESMIGLQVDAVRPLEGNGLRLSFSDGTIKDIDLSGELHGEVFEPLRDPGFFRSVAVNPETGTIEWPNGRRLRAGVPA